MRLEESCAHLFVLFSSCKAHHEQPLHWVAQEYRSRIHKAEVRLGLFHKNKRGSQRSEVSLRLLFLWASDGLRARAEDIKEH